MKTMNITSCDNCPFFHEDTDGWANDCSYRNENGDPLVDSDSATIAAMENTIPKNCPLRDGGVLVKIEKFG